MEIYPDKPLGNVLQIAMPRAPRLYAPGGTMHVMARCNNQEFYFTTPEDFEILMDHLREMARAYEVTVFAYTLMSNHLLLQAPQADELGRPLRWFMTEMARMFHRLCGRWGRFWERRYRACPVKEDLYVLAAFNSFILTAKQWIEKTGAIGLASKPERYGQYDRQ
jgi:putative transposase